MNKSNIAPLSEVRLIDSDEICIVWGLSSDPNFDYVVTIGSIGFGPMFKHVRRDDIELI